MNRSALAIAAAGVLVLSAAAPVMATPAQARQIKYLRALVAKDNRTIAAQSKAITGLTFKVNHPALPGTITTPAQAWALIPAFYGLFPTDSFQVGYNSSSYASSFTDSVGTYRWQTYSFSYETLTTP